MRGATAPQAVYLVFSEQGSIIKVNRYYISAYNASPDWAEGLRIKKAKGGGEFHIKFFEAAFNQEAEYAEMFIEFEEAVREKSLAQQLTEQGAGSICITTFQNMDGHDSASNALLRVWTLAAKTGVQYKRGDCPADLFKKTKAKQEAEEKLNMNKAEWDEKTQAAMKDMADLL